MAIIIRTDNADPENLQQAADIIRRGGIVAFPTETYYGLAVDPFNAAAVERLFTIKKRDRGKAVLTLIGNIDQLPILARAIPPVYEKLMARYWPGPLTLVFEADRNLPQLLLDAAKTVGIRISSHPAVGHLIRAFGGPITGTSANISGYPPAAGAEEVIEQLNDTIDLVLDGGVTQGQAGSTVLGIHDGRPKVFRSGVIPVEEIEDFLCRG